LTTASATYAESDGIVRTNDAVTFHRGGMSGSGVGMTYDKNNDVLTVAEQAHVTFTDETGATTMEFNGGRATLARRDHTLLVETHVHALRSEQTIDTDKAAARLTDNNEQITHMDLRGNSRVVGGSTAFDSMSAADIDLDYTSDGSHLEHVVLNGGGAIALTGANGAAGRQFFANHLAIALGPDNAVTELTGNENVKVDLPASKTSPRRTVRSNQIDATGE